MVQYLLNELQAARTQTDTLRDRLAEQSLGLLEVGGGVQLLHALHNLPRLRLNLLDDFTSRHDAVDQPNACATIKQSAPIKPSVE